MRNLLPVLPLHEPVLLPGMITRLQTSRPASVAAIELHLSDGRPLLAVPVLAPPADDLKPDELTQVGCSARVLRSVRLGDGSVRILLEGLQRIRVHAPRVDADVGISAVGRPFEERTQDPEQVELLSTRLREGLTRLIEEDKRLPPPLARLADLPPDPSRLGDHIAANLTLTPEDRLEILAEPSLDRRLDLVLHRLIRELELKKIDQRVFQQVQDNLDKQQREFYLREQIRNLRGELGDTPSALDENERLEQKLREVGMPEEVLEEALRELERLRRMHPDAAEYTVSRTWLEWLAGMPWQVRTTDNPDPHAARKVLDADHYGLDKVKERILEYLAVRQLKPEGKSPILCFVGPPGVGKTSLGRSIASALGRKFHRVSLGGVRDEAEIRGHRRTYVGALPGRIAHAMKRAGTKNPVLVLDELDKMGKDFRGDPASALLEVLDPEQNHEFVDHYLDVPFDLSQVLFICTANLEDPIPDALHDRLEVVELPGYILEEKVEIARRHLLGRLREDHGLTEQQLAIGPHAIRHIIEAYTREAGLRGLERELASLHRKAARQVVEGRKRALRIDSPQKVASLLGPPRHFIEPAERADSAGIAIGLAWTASGGDILFIEASSYPDKGHSLKLTGKLGDVMKESAEAAMSVIRTRSASLGIPDEAFQERLFHVHVPAGGIPKDGPSAGVTMLTALVSLLTGRKVRAHLAMTGEITLRGKVLPVGGVKEKVLAARRAGVKEVILPRFNEADLVDVPKALRREIQFHFVDNIEQVLALGLEP